MNLKKIILKNKFLVFPILLILISIVVVIKGGNIYSTLLLYIATIIVIYFAIVINIFLSKIDKEQKRNADFDEEFMILKNGLNLLNSDFYVMDPLGKIISTNSIVYNEYIGKNYEETKFKDMVNEILHKMPVLSLHNLSQDQFGLKKASDKKNNYYYILKPIFVSTKLEGFIFIVDNLSNKIQYFKQKKMLIKLWNNILDRAVNAYEVSGNELGKILDNLTSNLLIQESHHDDLKKLENVIKQSKFNISNLRQYIFQDTYKMDFVVLSKLKNIIKLEYKSYMAEYKKKLDIKIDIDEEQKIEVDWNKFKFAIDNILFNFIDHSGDSCRVLELTISKQYMIESSKEVLSIKFVNKNSKIDDEIFEKIKKFEPSSISSSHLGLGLVVAKDIIEHSKGILELKNINTGFSVNIKLPLVD